MIFIFQLVFSYFTTTTTIILFYTILQFQYGNMLYCLLHYVYLILVFTSFFYTDMTSDDMITIHLPSSILGIAYKLGQH